jgi:hypothetical protein
MRRATTGLAPFWLPWSQLGNTSVFYIVVVILVTAILGLILYVRARPELPALPWLLGPVVVTLLTGLWTAVVSGYTRYGDDTWALIPVLAALALVVVWHGGLVVTGPGRAVLLAYGLGHLAFWVYFALLCMLQISKYSL